MSSLEELERRVTALEERLQMEAGLRAAADRDLSSTAQNVRAQTHLIQALSITQSEHTDTLRELRETQLAHYAEHKADTAEIKTGIAHIVRLLEGLGEPGASSPDR